MLKDFPMSRWLLIVFALGCWGAWQHFHTRELPHPDGVLIGAEPVQTHLSNAAAFTFKNATLTPLEHFQLSARVLSRADYALDRGATLAPIDLALGWGRMSDSAVLAQLSMHQTGRYYLWRAERLPIPVDEIVASSSNMHLIPANPTIERQLRQTRVGDIVELSGDLVEARAADGWMWRSSLIRTDTGNGACELVYVKQFAIHRR